MIGVSRATGIAVGHGAATPDDVRLRHDEGVTMIGYGPDYGLLALAARAGIDALPRPASHTGGQRAQHQP